MALEKEIYDCPLKAIVEDIIGQCERLGVSVPKLALIKALAKDLPDAELFFDTADGSKAFVGAYKKLCNYNEN
ncbi:hypothetical protein QOT17_019097 [Balamuthia mandrillaris]